MATKIFTPTYMDTQTWTAQGRASIVSWNILCQVHPTTEKGGAEVCGSAPKSAGNSADRIMNRSSTVADGSGTAFSQFWWSLS